MAEIPRILAVIPARGGSKRLPQKNLLPLSGRALIHWSIKTAFESGVCKDVMVSTDDDQIAEKAREAGALVPWLRPPELATNDATTSAVIEHALNWYETENSPIDAVLILQPTSPFRSAESIRGAVKLYADQKTTNRQPVISVSPAATHPAWTFSWDGLELKPSLGWEQLSQGSQTLQLAYSLNGAIYIIPAEDARIARPIFRRGIKPYIMNNVFESLDIDTQEDWEMALYWASKNIN